MKDVIQRDEDFYTTPGDAVQCVRCGARVIVSKIMKASHVLCDGCKESGGHLADDGSLLIVE